MYACTDCLITANDSTYSHPRGIEYADICYTDFDYCSDHYSENGPCVNCDDGTGDVSAYYDGDDGTGVTCGGSCDLCGTAFPGYWTHYRYQD